jgi:hypothetical protein
MNIHNHPPVNSLNSQSKDKTPTAKQKIKKHTNIHSFVIAVPYLKKIGKKAVYNLALRFNVSPQHLQKRINKATERGGQYET